MKVLFVCHGNINRSAAAEVILKELRPDMEVKSAGLKPNCGNRITTKKMREALALAGLPCTGFKSQQLTQELVDWADIIFYMDYGNERRLHEEFGLLDKAVSMASIIEWRSIPDPNFTRGNELHQQVIKLLQKAISTWITDLSKTV